MNKEIKLCKTAWGKLYFVWENLVDIYEKEIWNCLACPRDGVAIDIGAHQGFYTIKLAKESGEKGRVIAIEPAPENFEILCKNIELNHLTNVTPINKALSNYNGIGTLYTYDLLHRLNSGKHFLRGTNLDEPHGRELDKPIPSPQWPTSVDVMTLDKIVEELNLNRIDIIKMDVEGAEVKIIEGSQNVLTHFEPKLVIEIHYNHEIDKLLRKYGYMRTEHYERLQISSNPQSIYEKVIKGERK